VAARYKYSPWFRLEERRVKCMELMNELEKHKYMDNFYDEFSMAMLNSELLKKIIDREM